MNYDSKAIENYLPLSTTRYCMKCRGEVSSEAVCSSLGWCENCKDTVDVQRCGVSYWAVGATIALSLAQPFSNWPC